MLKTRALTAVGLLAVFLPGLFFLPPLWWAVLTAGVAGVAGWEWGRLSRFSDAGSRAYGVVLGLSCAAFAGLFPGLAGDPGVLREQAGALVALYGLAAVFWLLVVPLWLRGKWALKSAPLGAAVGFLVVWPAWLALVQLRLAGPVALLAILAAVWVADVAAYFSGKNFGRRKLAPSISPGKTWEGAIGAGVAVLAYSLALRPDGGMFPVALWVPGILLLTAVSIIGDLFESLLKRQCGLKDSSSILPGHGGVLDRIDSLTSTLPLVTLVWLLSLSFA